MSIEPFKRLVKLAARAFYDDITKGDHQPKAGRSDNRGICVVVLDTLTKHQWVKEEALAKELKLHAKQLRRTLRFFEEEKFISRDHRKETSKGAKLHNAAIAATTDAPPNGREGESKLDKMHTHSYCCLDYAQIYDVLRYRLHKIKKKLKDEVEDKNTIQEYICPNCSKRYTALDALRLLSEEDDNFHCESCNAELVAESDKLAAEEMGDGDDNARRRRREKLKDMLRRVEEQFKPVMDQLAKVKDLPVPEFGSLLAWERQAAAAARRNGDSSSTDFSRTSQEFGTPMPYVGETKVEVAFSGGEDKEDIKAENSSTPMKVLPPWMIKQGMNLTKEQRGEVKDEIKMEGTSAAAGLPDDKKSMTVKNDETSFQDEYVKAYYAALLKRQQEQENAAKGPEFLDNGISNNIVERQVGTKSRRDEDEVEEEVEWEETAAENTAGLYKVDLNVEADDASGGDEDDIDWEEG